MKEQRDTVARERYSQQHGRCLGVAVEESRTDKSLTLSEVAKRASAYPAHPSRRLCRRSIFVATRRVSTRPE